MTNEELAKEISQYPLTAIATGLLNLENNRESALAKACKEIELDSLKLSDEERRKRFGARIRMMRQLLGLKQVDLAEKLNISPQALAIYETGRREPNLKNLIALARALNTTADWLLGEPPPLPQ